MSSCQYNNPDGGDTIKLAIIILAAGFSRRMGVLKPLLPVGKLPAVLLSVSKAHALGIRDVLVITGSRREEIEAVLREKAPDVRFVHNENYQSGMFSSIIAGARALPQGLDGFFLLPADHCAVSQNTLLELIDVFRASGGGTVIRPKLGDKRGHPPLIPAKFIAPLLNYSGEDGMRGFLNTCPFTPVMTEDRGVLLDMDTPADYSELLEYMGLPTYPDIRKCRALLGKYETPPHVIEHCEQVAHIAQRIAILMQSRGAALDMNLLEAACLIHDILRVKPNHAEEGMKLLLREGYPKAAMLVGGHMDGSGEFSGEITKSELLFLADKLCRYGSVSPIAETLENLRVKLKDDPEALEAACRRMNRAQNILDTLGSRYGISFEDIAES